MMINPDNVNAIDLANRINNICHFTICSKAKDIKVTYKKDATIVEDIARDRKAIIRKHPNKRRDKTKDVMYGILQMNGIRQREIDKLVENGKNK